MTELRERMTRDLKLKGYSEQTQQLYLLYVELFAKHFGKSPDQLGDEEVKEFLYYMLSEKKISSSYLNCIYSGIKFFYEVTLQKEWKLSNIRTKREKKLPMALSQDEIEKIFNVVPNLKHKALLMTIYGAGLRVSEAANLKVSDIDSSSMQIHISSGKGKKERYCLLSKSNLEILKEYYKVYKPTNWLFNGRYPDKPISKRSIQDIFYKARKKAGIMKSVSVHSLRHSFATHLLNDGVDIFHIQRLLGHSSLRTTSIYIHLKRKDLMNIVSPLDRLTGKE